MTHSPRRNALILLSAPRRLILAARTARSRAGIAFISSSTPCLARAIGAASTKENRARLT